VLVKQCNKTKRHAAAKKLDEILILGRHSIECKIRGCSVRKKYNKLIVHIIIW